MRNLLAAMTVTMIVGASPGMAVEDSDIATCAALAGDLDRLQCFDDLAAAAHLDAPRALPVPTVGTGNWVVSRDQNPIDDSERVVLILAADEGRTQFGEDVLFVARCLSNQTEAYVKWNDYLGNDGTSQQEFKRVTIRVGSAPAKTESWGLSTDSQSTFAPGWAGDLLKSMATETRLIVQTTPYNASPVTAIFDTTGLAEALAPLAEVCGWES